VPKRLGDFLDPRHELALNPGKTTALNMDEPVLVTRLAAPLE